MTVFTRRIAGIETEYGLTSAPADPTQRRISPDDLARLLFQPIAQEYGSSNIFLPNASRLYLDVGSHPEIATAECDSVSQLVAYDRAGDQIMDQMGQAAEKALAEKGTPTKVFLFKNNLDSQGNSYGSHENYLVSRDVVLKTLGKQLLPFLVTRQLIAGAGTIVDGEFHLSQRAYHVWEGVSSATTRSRPIINTRDEPHADSHKYRRLHVISGDSTMAEPTTALKLGSTLLILEMIEAGMSLPDVELKDPIAVLRLVTTDISGTTPVELASGELSTALEIQKNYCAAAKEWLAQRAENTPGTTNAEMAQILNLWESVLKAVESRDYESISSTIDWAAKLSLLRKFQQRLGLEPTDFSHPKLAQVDLAYHDIRPGRGIERSLEEKGLIKKWVSDEAIEAAVRHAPTTTRAHLRGQFLAQARAHQTPISVDWTRLKVSRPEPHIVELLDPFSTQNSEVESLITYLSDHAAMVEEEN